jgi:TruD family tRNA pseudouridine synthase
MQNQNLWEKEQQILRPFREESPELFILPTNTKRSLAKTIGITIPLDGRPKGYVKYSPFDFIVEEITTERTVLVSALSDLSITSPSVENSGRTLYADMTKIALTTHTAINQIAECLGISKDQISYAGIKDAGAITAQEIAIRDVPKEKLNSLTTLAEVMLKNIRTGKGILKLGQLNGNRFTILIRTEASVPEAFLQQKLKDAEKNGVVNFYGPQRFGAPRYNTHLYGKALFEGNPEKAIRIFMTDETEFELPIMKAIRRQGANVYGDWRKMRESFLELPYSFRIEIELLDILIKIQPRNKYDYIRALSYLKEYIKIWVYSYASYAANLFLSNLIESKAEIPNTIPLLACTDKNTPYEYEQFLRNENVWGYQSKLAELSFLQLPETAYLQTKMYPKIIGSAVTDEGVALSFELPKGSYATTFIESLFDIFSDMKFPEWLKTNHVDTKKLLSTGSLDDLEQKFSKYFYPESRIE